jgi:protein-S-isoprenylcysteine O-methyltransferase Ste14
MIWRFLPLIGLFLVFAIAGCWRPWLQRRRYGTSGIALFKSKTPGQNLRDAMLVVLAVPLAGQAVVAAGSPERLSLLGAADRSAGGLWQFAGAGLMFAGIALLAAAQLDLGASWRIGIDDGAKPGLVTGGLFRFCRNPIFLALLVIITGYTLMIPSVLSLALLVGAYIGIRLQIAAEESYLQRAYGDSFREYAHKVGRLLPGIGKLR